jgi:SAM-dependent methyltransferase
MTGGAPLHKPVPLTACPACHSRSASPVKLGNYPLRKCTDCHLVYAEAYADPDEIYVEGYFAGQVGDFGVDTSDPAWEAFFEHVARGRMDIVEGVVPMPGRILDVGCGPGHTLAEAKRRGWEGVGVDLVSDAVEQAVSQFGLDVRLTLLEDSGLPERSFDVVATTQVLEHQQDGTAFLTSIARWVKPGGHLFVEVPNWQSANRWASKENWVLLKPLEHLGHYSPRTLPATLRRIGLTPVAVSTPSYRMIDQQTVGDSVAGLGLTWLAPWMRRDLFSEPVTRAGGVGEVVRIPKPMTRRALKGVDAVQAAAKVGTMVAVVARVP